MPRMMTMELVCKVGPYAGMTLEYPQHVGEALLASGQAELPPQARKATENAAQPRVETPEAPSLDNLTRKQLEDLAAERGIEVERAEGEGLPVKADYVRALGG